ncbi:MAG: hypothetical protein ABIS86_08615 [Streptosporangiaceae bacterium]
MPYNTIYTDDADIYQKPEGTRLCVYTETGLLGIIVIKQIDHNYVTFDLTVWQGPADQ